VRPTKDPREQEHESAPNNEKSRGGHTCAKHNAGDEEKL
jgi:hypothetical protein